MTSLVVPAGPASIVVCGAVVSTVKLRLAGSVGVAGRVGRAHLERVRAVVEAAERLRRRARCQAPPSIRHSKLEPGSLDVNSNVGVASAVGPDGPASIVVCGAVVSTVKLRLAGV